MRSAIHLRTFSCRQFLRQRIPDQRLRDARASACAAVVGLSALGLVIVSRQRHALTLPRSSLLFSLAGALAMSVFASHGSAQVSFYEPFNYTLASNLNGQSGATGAAGSWTTSGSPPATIGTSLSYPGLTSTGGAATFAGATDFSATAHLAGTYGTPNSTVWVSFVVNETSPASDGIYGGLVFANVFTGFGSVNGNDDVGLGSVTAGDSITGATLGTPGTTLFFVTRFDFNGTGNVTFNTYLDPTGSGSPNGGSLISTGSNSYGASDVNQLLIGTNAASTWDEIRIGSSYGDVSAIPEPSTYAAIFGLGALGFAAWRRRRTGGRI
jgi:hypothetical protein